LTEVMPGPMTATRQFSSNDRVAVYAEVYDNISDTDPHTVTVRTVLRTEEGVPVRTVEAERSSAVMNRRQDGYGFLFEVPLNGVTAGAYVLSVEATANAGDRPRQSRSIPIRVR
jgi:hypothetical protein